MKITVNSRSTGKYRKEVLNNRPHLVTTMVSIEGDSVMNRLFYPLGEVESAFNQLDALPAPAGHPKVGDKHVDAFHPLAMNAFNVGAFVKSPTMSGNQVINEIWIDIEVANKDERGKEFMRRIQKGERVGVSTGLNADVSNESGEHNGKPFRGSVSNIKFNHVAFLLETDPAGDNTYTVNSEELVICNLSLPAAKGKTNREVQEMDKEKLVLGIIANNANGYTMSDKDFLMSLPDDRLVEAAYNKLTKEEITVDQAQKVIEKAGMTVNGKDFKPEEYKVYLNHKSEFESYLAEIAKEKAAKVEEIVANTEMTEEQVNAMSSEGFDSLYKSLSVLSPQNYTINANLGSPPPKREYQGSKSTIKLHDEA